MSALLERSSAVSDVRLPSSGGMGPESWFVWRNSVTSDASAPSYAGTRPVRPQLETSSTVRLRSALSAGGMPPSNTL